MWVLGWLVSIAALAWSPAGPSRDLPAASGTTIPGVSKISPANAIGVLKYCKENALLSDASVGNVVDVLAEQADPTSEDYIVGSSGQILGDAGRNFSIFRAPSALQSQACAAVLERTKLFGR